MSMKAPTPRQRPAKEEGSPESTSSTSKAKAKPKAGVLGRVTAKAASAKKTDATPPETPRGAPRKARTDTGLRLSQSAQGAAQPSAETSIPRTNEEVGGATTRDGNQLIKKSDLAVEAAREQKVASPSAKNSTKKGQLASKLLKGIRSGKVAEIVNELEEASQCSPSTLVPQVPAPREISPPRDENVEREEPMAKGSGVQLLDEVAQKRYSDDPLEKEWSQFTGLAAKFDKVNERLATNIARSSSPSGSSPRSELQKRETHHRILQLQEEVKKLQAPYDEIQARGQRDRDNQLALERLQMEMRSLRETVIANKPDPPRSPRISSQVASVPVLPESTSTFEPNDVAPQELLPSLAAVVHLETENFPTVVRSSHQLRSSQQVGTSGLASKLGEQEMSPSKCAFAAEMDLPMAHNSYVAETDWMSNAITHLGQRRDGREEGLQDLLSDVYDKICVCSERLEEQKAASKAATNGWESLNLPETLLDEDDAKRETWKEIGWLKRALVGMHQHLMSAQERTRALELQCQQYVAHVQTGGTNYDQARLSASFNSNVSQGLQAASDFPLQTTTRDFTLLRDSDGPSFPPSAPLLTSPPKVNPPQTHQPSGSFAGAQERSPTNLSSSFQNDSAVDSDFVLRGVLPMQDLDASTSFAYEPYLNITSSGTRQPPMVATSPPFDGLAFSSSGFHSPPSSVLLPTAVSMGSTAESYPSGVASVGAPGRPVSRLASYPSGSTSVGVPGRHIPASSSRPPSLSPLRQQRPVSIGPASAPLGLMQRIPVAVGSSPHVQDIGVGTALFNRIDTNKDGVIDRWELKAAVKAGTLQAGSAWGRHAPNNISSSARVTPHVNLISPRI